MGDQTSFNEKIDLFYKKSQGVPYAYPDENGNKKVGLEPGLNARQRVYPLKQIFSDPIPDTAYDTDLSSTIIDVSYNDNGTFKSAGTYRVHKSFSYIRKYTDIKLKSIQPLRSYWFIGTNDTNNPDGTNILNNSIPYNYNVGKTYSPEVKINGLPVSSDSGLHQWYLDPDAGILTFYDNIKPEDKDKVTITFWRYEGRFGFQSTDINAPKLAFDGGTPDTDFSNPGRVVVISGGGA